MSFKILLFHLQELIHGDPGHFTWVTGTAQFGTKMDSIKTQNILIEM